MKILSITTIIMLLAIGWAAAIDEYTPPTDEQLHTVLTKDAAKLDTLFEGADSAQAADVAVRMIRMIDTSPAGKTQKKQAIAVLTARLVRIMGDQAPDTIATVVAAIDENWRSTVVAAAYLAAGDDAEELLAAVIAKLGADSDAAAAARAAAENPGSVLGRGLIRILNRVILDKGDTTGRGLMIVPLPPVADRYEGQ